jgi:hypothetical protein
MADTPKPGGRARAPGKTAAKRQNRRRSKQWIDPAEPASRYWRDYFLEKLAETSNVKASADHAGVNTGRAYQARREDPAFAAAWRAALYEGYQHLEMEVLGFLRSGDPERKFDVANAIRLLAAHKATVAQERAAIDDRDEQAVLDSIDAMIDEMRERSAANAALPDHREEADGTAPAAG